MRDRRLVLARKDHREVSRHQVAEARITASDVHANIVHACVRALRAPALLCGIRIDHWRRRVPAKLGDLARKLAEPGAHDLRQRGLVFQPIDPERRAIVVDCKPGLKLLGGCFHSRRV